MKNRFRPLLLVLSLLAGRADGIDPSREAAFLEQSRLCDSVVLVAEFHRELIPPSKEVTKGTIETKARVVRVFKGDVKLNRVITCRALIEDWPRWLERQSKALPADLQVVVFDSESATEGVEGTLFLGDALMRVEYYEGVIEKLEK